MHFTHRSESIAVLLFFFTNRILQRSILRRRPPIHRCCLITISAQEK